MTNNFNDTDLSIINSLNDAYNNNLRSIQNFTNSINDLTDMNVKIHNSIVEILNNNRNSRWNSRENINRTNVHRNTSRTTTSSNLETANSETTNSERNLGRVLLNNVPYIIDSVQHYRLPSRGQREQPRSNNFSNLLQRFFQPIEIFPTQTQIETATRNVRYCDILNPINRSCPISLENFSDSDYVTVIRYCGHIFNRNELNTWFRSNCRCPVCRYDVRNYNSSNSNYFDLSGNQTRNISIDTSNNLVNDEENTDQENIDNDEVERSTEEPLNNNTNFSNSTSNNGATYFDLFFGENTLLNNFSTISDASDPIALVNLLRALQRNSR
jgi:hypothetical protein